MANNNIFNPPETTEASANIIVDHMPVGRAWANKGVKGSILNSLIRGLSSVFLEVQEKIYELSQEFNINLSDDLLPDWETSVGLPDSCIFDLTELSERRESVLRMFSKVPIVTNADFVNLALELSGLDVTIESGTDASVFPLMFPYVFLPSNPRFTMVVTFNGTTATTFPFTFPITFQADARIDIVKCVFNVVKPANVTIIYTQ